MTAKKNIIAFKGFDKNFQCRGFAYQIGETYKHDGDVAICNNGFHACTNPFDVWNYYGPDNSRFAAVEMAEPVTGHDSDTKITAAEITIKAELTLPDFIGKAIDHISNLCLFEKDPDDTDSAKIGSSGDSAKIGSSGYSAKIESSGEKAIVACAGFNSIVQGKKGCAIALVYRDKNAQARFAAAVVGENGIMPDTLYRVNKNGEFVEVES